MKFLFISEYILNKPQGAKASAIAHYDLLCKLIGEKNVDVLALTLSSDVTDDRFICMKGYRNHFEEFINIAFGRPFMVNKEIEKKFISLIKANSYDLIFFDNSYFGSMIKEAKRINNIPIACYYHGVKFEHVRQELIRRKHKVIYYLPKSINMIIQEYLTVRYADINFLLNSRDSSNLIKYYKHEPEAILPVFFDSKISKYEVADDNSGIFKILFVGGYFYPNIEGIKWFIKNVLPNLSGTVKFYLVGRDLEKLRDYPEIYNNKDVEIVGGVEDLSHWYSMAHIVVGPIFSGEGMKTKTAEALKYGKIYLGTTEAMCGYDGLDEYLCNTAEDFINKINRFILDPPEKFNKNIREIFLEKYSSEAAGEILKNAFAKVGVVLT